MEVKDLSLVRVGDTDDVYVTGLVSGVQVVVHVWYSHLYGDNEASLHGDAQAIRAYAEQELQAALARELPSIQSIVL